MKFFKKNAPEIVEREDGLIDYDVYVLSKKEKILYIVLAAIIIFAVGMVFYHSVIMSLVLSIFSLKAPNLMRTYIIKRRKSELNIKFKDFLYSLSSSMGAGKSLEMAIKSSYNDMKVIYPDENDTIMQEIKYMIRMIEMNETVESALLQFAERAHIEDIENFADIIRICKRTGGNLVEVIRSTSSMICDKIETRAEIETMITAKKFESRILSAAPIVMVLLLSTSSPDFMEPVFTTLLGRFVMTIAIALFVVAFIVSEKIMDIEV